MERSNKSERKQYRKYMEGTKETYRKKDTQETLGTTIFFSAESFRGFFRRRKGDGWKGGRKGGSKDERTNGEGRKVEQAEG